LKLFVLLKGRRFGTVWADADWRSGSRRTFWKLRSPALPGTCARCKCRLRHWLRWARST